MRARLPCRLGDRTVLLKTGQPLTSREELRFTGGGGGGTQSGEGFAQILSSFSLSPYVPFQPHLVLHQHRDRETQP